MNLFTYAETYPNAPGFKRTDTSQAAAESMQPTAGSLRAAVLAELRRGNGTADEIADRLGLSILAIRPRCTELRAMGRIIDSGERRANASGRSAICWAAA